MAGEDSLVSRAAKLISQQEQVKRAPPILSDIYVFEADQNFVRLDEGQRISGRFEHNIRIDQPTYGAGQQHAHILGRKGNELGVVNLDGSASHGTKCTLHTDDANALRARGFSIRPDNIVEWTVLPEQPSMILG